MSELAPVQATSDDALVYLWLHGRSWETQRAYTNDVAALRAYTPKPLRELTLADLQGFAFTLAGYAVPTQIRRLKAIKSLLTFGQKIGYLPINVGGALRVPRARATLAERIVSEEDILKMLATMPAGRDRVLVRLAYATGGRVSELCRLRWRDAQPRAQGAGQVVLFGKGDKTRVVLVSKATWSELLTLRTDLEPDAPIFRSKHGALSTMQAWRIIKAAARRAGLPEGFSPHWLRHAHASHALDRGASIALVKETLGHASVETTDKYLHARPEDSSGRYLPV